MPHMKTTWLALAIIAVAILVSSIVLALRSYHLGAEAPLFRIDLWHEGRALVTGQMMLRREAKGSGALLIKHSERATVYAYDPTKRSLAPAADGAWERAAGPVAECDAQAPPDGAVLRVDTTSHKLFAGTREVPTAGRTAIVLTASPSGRLSAALSATGSVRGSLMPFLGVGGASGQYMHQVLSLPEAAPVGEAVRVPRLSSRDNLSACWSADEQFVVYHEILFFYLSIVETGLSSTPKKVSP